MANFDINNFVIDHVLRGIMTSSADGSYMWSINQITDPSLNVTSETAEAVDALGSKIAVFNRGKSAEFTASNSLFDLSLYAAQNGVSKEIADENNTITAPAFETYEFDGQATTYKPKHVPNKAIDTIYKLNGDGTLGTAFVSGTSASATKFVYDEETHEITLPTGLKKEDQIFMMYDYEAEAAVAVTGDAINFPKAGKFVLEVLGTDTCDPTTLIHAFIEFPNAKLDANVDMSFTTDGNHPFTIQCQQNYCDPKKTLFRIVIPKEA